MKTFFERGECKLEINSCPSKKNELHMGGGPRAAPSLPMGVDEGDVVCMRIRGGPSPPRVLREC